jgi:hypothetical protein
MSYAGSYLFIANCLDESSLLAALHRLSDYPGDLDHFRALVYGVTGWDLGNIAGHG